MAANSQLHDMTLRRLQRQLAWSLGVAVLALLGVIALAIAWWASFHGDRDGILRTHGVVVVDPQGHDKILIGEAAIATAKTTSSYGRTNSIVFLNRAGGYHLALGQTPEPVVNGKAVGRVSATVITTVSRCTTRTEANVGHGFPWWRQPRGHCPGSPMAVRRCHWTDG